MGVVPAHVGGHQVVASSDGGNLPFPAASSLLGFLDLAAEIPKALERLLQFLVVSVGDSHLERALA